MPRPPTERCRRACSFRDRVRTAARLGESHVTLHRDDLKVPLLMRLYRVASYTEARPGEAEALDVLAQLLGGDATSTLYRELVVKRKLASDANASYSGYAATPANSKSPRCRAPACGWKRSSG